MTNHQDEMLDIDHDHVWHPYSAVGADLPVFPVASAHGVQLQLTDGRELIDGMSSWWSVIHGYNHPALNQAIESQLSKMSHVMFGGLTHQPAVDLAERLIGLTPKPLETVFFADSGSVAVEVALKMAIQYWQAKGSQQKQRFVTVRGGYHGDTFGAMSVCDPQTGMHSHFSDILAKQFFADIPRPRFGEMCQPGDLDSLRNILHENHKCIAALILEPIVQGAGGMRFYSADYLDKASELCKEFNVLLIADEIATGFGRSGKMFACEHANVEPDIMCIGKALTGGYLSLAATLTSREIAGTISSGDPGVLMHGPTFMANPLACSVAIASLDLLEGSPWQQQIATIEKGLLKGLAPCSACSHVEDVRVLGAIGVIELKEPVDMKYVQQRFVDEGVWVRPFGKLVYLMPPYVINQDELETLISAVSRVVTEM